MRRASHSRDAELVPLTTSFAMTGSAKGRVQNGSETTIASTTQLLPPPVLCLPCAEPSWNHDAAHLHGDLDAQDTRRKRDLEAVHEHRVEAHCLLVIAVSVDRSFLGHRGKFCFADRSHRASVPRRTGTGPPF